MYNTLTLFFFVILDPNLATFNINQAIMDPDLVILNLDLAILDSPQMFWTLTRLL